MSAARPPAPGWACPSCGRTGQGFVPSGRCRECEEAIAALGAPVSADAVQIGEVAERVGLSLRTVRFYEEEGLVLPAGRTPGGFRLYDERAVQRLLLITQMKPLGFSLEEMRGLLEAADSLNQAVLSPEERIQLLERLAMYEAAAREKCESLRRQLGVAEGFAARLGQEVNRHGGVPGPAGQADGGTVTTS